MPLKREMIDISDPRVAQIGHPAPPWLVNYADLMTELVCFFVILYAMAAALNKNVTQAKKDIEEELKKEPVKVEVKVDKDGMKITLQEQKDNVFFQSGSIDLSPHMKEILAKIAPALNKLAHEDHDIIVEGHTDDVPIRNPQYPSNWELSTARATNVVQYMVHNLKTPPQKMGATGYGQFHPVVPNDSDEHRSMNRRVVFFVKNNPAKFEGKEGHKKPAETALAPPVDESPAAADPSESPDSSASEDNATNPIPEPNN